MAKKGRVKKWLQEASKRMEEKGTKGAFTAYCKKKGYKGVTQECIEEAKRSGNPTLKKRAIFAENVRKIARKRKAK